MGEEGGLAVPLLHVASNQSTEKAFWEPAVAAPFVQLCLVSTQHFPASISTMSPLSFGKRFSFALGSQTGILKAS